MNWDERGREGWMGGLLGCWVEGGSLRRMDLLICCR